MYFEKGQPTFEKFLSACAKAHNFIIPKNANAFFGIMEYARYANSYNLRKSLFSKIIFERKR